MYEMCFNINYQRRYIMVEENKGRKITFHCPDDIAERLDKLAEISGTPRSRLVLNMVVNGIEFLESTKKVGILSLSLLLRDAGEKLQEVSKKWRKKNQSAI